MSVTLWLSTEKEATIELGNTLACYQAFAEMKRAVGDERWGEDYANLAGVLTQCEWQEDADPEWLADVRREAEDMLASDRGDLSPNTVRILELLSKSPILNAFCPTGEGGGVDPSCSPSNVSPGGLRVGDRVTVFAGSFKQDTEVIEVTKAGRVRISSHPHLWFRWNKGESSHVSIASTGAMGKAGPPSGAGYTIHRRRNVENELRRNSFCPTGSGGGVDPSCSPNVARIADRIATASTKGDRRDVLADVNALKKDQLFELHKHLNLPGNPSMADTPNLVMEHMRGRGTSPVPQPAPAREALVDDRSVIAKAFAAHPSAKDNLVDVAEIVKATGKSHKEVLSTIERMRKEGVLSASKYEGRHFLSEEQKRVKEAQSHLSDEDKIGFVSVRSDAQHVFKGLLR